LDNDEIINLLLKHNRNGAIFKLIESERFIDEAKDSFILEVFKYTM